MLFKYKIVHVPTSHWRGDYYFRSSGYCIQESFLWYSQYHSIWESDGNGDGWWNPYMFGTVQECRDRIKQLRAGTRRTKEYEPRPVIEVIK